MSHSEQKLESNDGQTGLRVETFVAALHALDREGSAALAHMSELFAADAKLSNSALRQSDSTADVVQFWTSYCETMHEARTDFHAVTLGRNCAGLFWTTTAKSLNGQRVDYEGATWLRYDASGKICWLQGYFDTRELALRVAN